MKERNRISSALSATFTCTNTQASASQANILNFNISKINTVETFNLIGSICSILGLLVTIFLTTQVVSIKNKMTDNSTNNVKQEKNKVKKGDIAGRDVKK